MRSIQTGVPVAQSELRQPLDVRPCGQSERGTAESEGATTADKMLDLYPSPQIIPVDLCRSRTQHLRFDSSSHQPAVQRGFEQEERPVTAAHTPSKRRFFLGGEGGRFKLENKNASRKTNKRRLSDTRTGSHDSAGGRFAEDDETESAPELREGRLLSGR